mmetsp:Transcript_44298/g.146825  ORF Transcript_44298/g.146825 Transcript_44298/m.146825 type:complete len:285 (+) Transcript_44298:1645-2499(+)
MAAPAAADANAAARCSTALNTRCACDRSGSSSRVTPPRPTCSTSSSEIPLSTCRGRARRMDAATVIPLHRFPLPRASRLRCASHSRIQSPARRLRSRILTTCASSTWTRARRLMGSRFSRRRFMLAASRASSIRGRSLPIDWGCPHAWPTTSATAPTSLWRTTWRSTAPTAASRCARSPRVLARTTLARGPTSCCLTATSAQGPGKRVAAAPTTIFVHPRVFLARLVDPASPGLSRTLSHVNLAALTAATRRVCIPAQPRQGATRSWRGWWASHTAIRCPSSYA